MNTKTIGEASNIHGGAQKGPRTLTLVPNLRTKLSSTKNLQPDNILKCVKSLLDKLIYLGTNFPKISIAF